MARELEEAGPCRAGGGRRPGQIARRVLDADDVRDGRQPRERIGGDVDARPLRHRVKQEREVDRAGGGGVVPVEALMYQLGVVGRNDERCGGACGPGGPLRLDAAARAVRAAAGDDRDAPGGGLDGDAE